MTDCIIQLFEELNPSQNIIFAHYIKCDSYISDLVVQLSERVELFAKDHRDSQEVNKKYMHFLRHVCEVMLYNFDYIERLELIMKLTNEISTYAEDFHVKKEVQEIYNLADSYITAIKLTGA